MQLKTILANIGAIRPAHTGQMRADRPGPKKKMRTPAKSSRRRYQTVTDYSSGD
jgi:hypothetical protein